MHRIRQVAIVRPRRLLHTGAFPITRPTRTPARVFRGGASTLGVLPWHWWSDRPDAVFSNAERPARGRCDRRFDPAPSWWRARLRAVLSLNSGHARASAFIALPAALCQARWLSLGLFHCGFGCRQKSSARIGQPADEPVRLQRVLEPAFDPTCLDAGFDQFGADMLAFCIEQGKFTTGLADASAQPLDLASRRNRPG